MSDINEGYHVEKASKKLVISDRCQYCFGVKEKIVANRALCRKCLRLMGGGSEYGNACNGCKMRASCEQRVHSGLWALCEVPDVTDIKRANAYEDNESVGYPVSIGDGSGMHAGIFRPGHTNSVG